MRKIAALLLLIPVLALATANQNFLPPVHLISGKAMTANITSAVVDVRWLSNMSIQCNWSAGSSPSGTLAVLESVDDVNFTSMPTSSSVTVSGNSGTAQIDFNQVPGPYIEVTYTFSSGTGTLDCYVSGKGF